MPPKNGPATAKTQPAEDAPVSDAAEASPDAPKAKETAEEPAEDEKDLPIVYRPGPKDREEAAKLYPEDTQLWYAEINHMVFAFPRIMHITPTRQWLRAVYQLTELAQTFEWMALAKVPDEMQALTDLLSDDQYQALFRAWYIDGEVSLPK